MRKVTEKMTRALKDQHATHSGNNVVTTSYETNSKGQDVLVSRLYLHGNNIATYGDGLLTLNDCGWQTNTTKERLNGVLHHFGIAGRITQKDWMWYFVVSHFEAEPTGTNPWDGRVVIDSREPWDGMRKQWEVA